MKKITHPQTGKLIMYELTAPEMAKLLGASVEDLYQWRDDFPPAKDNIWHLHSEKEARQWKEKARELQQKRFTLSELAEELGLSEERVSSCSKAFPETSPGVWEPSADDFLLWKKRAALLGTHMTEQAVLNVEQEGRIDAYVELSKDCPEGITAHVWRSYGCIVALQIRNKSGVSPAELARAAGLGEKKNGKIVDGVELAEKHIRYLEARGYLKKGEGDWEGLWEHKGLPEYFQAELGA